jgi:XapX domain-containing protein
MFNRLRTLIDAIIFSICFALVQVVLSLFDITIPAPAFVVLIFAIVGMRAGQKYVEFARSMPEPKTLKAFSWGAAFDCGAVQLIISLIGVALSLLIDPEIAAQFDETPLAFFGAVVAILSFVFYFVGVFLFRIFANIGARAAYKNINKARSA